MRLILRLPQHVLVNHCVKFFHRIRLIYKFVYSGSFLVVVRKFVGIGAGNDYDRSLEVRARRIVSDGAREVESVGSRHLHVGKYYVKTLFI